MEFYLFILVVLFATAIADLIVGVSNDAVNFLNSAIGSKVATRRTILIIAGLGVLIGTTFSSGIMEVARKGIFNPEYFVMHDVMIIFLAVMLTDIILLDLYNTFALPTSTTVSIVFEILGGAVAISLITLNRTGADLSKLFDYINTANVLVIISGIGLSIIFAFIFGVTIQFLTRVIFSFEYERPFKRYGALYCAAALTAITYFIVVKGAKGSTLVSTDTAKWLMSHMTEFLMASFLIWAVIWQIVISFTRINVLKIIVLIGTFALALAFAANDLVNFIGAPLGALSAYQVGTTSPGNDPFSITMEALNNPVTANTWILLVAGAVMVVTLWLSRKARSVTKTEVSLGRQEEGVERFESVGLARAIVRMSIALVELFKKITPQSFQNKISERLDPDKYNPPVFEDGERPAFDLLRATVNLMVASALISFGTSLKLPLSTTFVTFMVAMSTSLADRAWGRESAVYRVTGVLTVIGGWFFTAVMAFSACFTFAFIIYFGNLPAILALIALGAFFYYRTTRYHRNRELAFERREREFADQAEELDTTTLLMRDISKYLSSVAEIAEVCYAGLIENQRKQLKAAKNQAETLSEDTTQLVADIFQFVKVNPAEDFGQVPRYAHQITALQTISSDLNELASACFNHVNNNHKAPDPYQAEELKAVSDSLINFVKDSARVLKEKDFVKLSRINENAQSLKILVGSSHKNQIKRLKSGEAGTRRSRLFISIVSYAERMATQTLELVKLLSPSATTLSSK